MDFPVCAVVVTYNCGPGVGPTIRSLLPQVDRLIVVDNGSGGDTRSFLEGFRPEGGTATERIYLPENVGIAGALNTGVRGAIDAGYRWVLTMDHDSVADAGMVEALRGAIRRDGAPEEILLSAPVYVDRQTGEAGRLYRYEGWRRKRLFPGRDGGNLAPTVAIASGNLVNAAAYLAVGGFDESLAIDYVDHDFCLRGRLHGFRVVCAADARLGHSIGKAVVRRALGRTFRSSNHSPERRYTMGRNLAEMARRYHREFPGYVLWSCAEFARDAVAILACEQDRWIKLRMVWRGLRESRSHFAGAHR